MIVEMGSDAVSRRNGRSDVRQLDSMGSMGARLEALKQLNVGSLRGELRRLYGTEPPQLSRDLVLRAVAYRIQERASGGLSRASERKLMRLAGELRAGGEVMADAGPRLRPGARLVREWRGRTHAVDVGDNGFTYAGTIYQSLTPIAKAITGAHWSGPSFFELVKRSAPNEAS